MKHYSTFIFLFTVLIATVSCTRENDINSPDVPTSDIYITDSVRYESDKMTAYNFVYPSTDPYGNPVKQSATITIGDDVTRQSPARGLILYNHYTIYRADQCPTRGELNIQKILLPSKLITISPDYYGFGATADKNQAYCISQVNAQSSVDALLAAKKLLAEMGFHWGDWLFNVGYSQGAQTTMGVVRLVTERYPDIHLTYSFAGAGPYDIHETYRQLINATLSGMPSTVISVLLSFNEYFKLGIPHNEVFREPVLSNIDNWILSKRYTRQEIDAFVGSLSFAEYVTPTMMDTTSNISLLYMQAMEHDNICQGWIPRKDERIFLFHNTIDITVPKENTINMYNFLIKSGATAVEMDTANYGGTATMPAHETGALFFMMQCVNKMSSVMGVEPWSIF